MFCHLKHIDGTSNVVMRTSDTDCLVIALGCKHLYDSMLNLWLEVGVQSNNTQRFINVNSLYTCLGELFCKSLPAYHALTGCDYTASFARRGKVKPLIVLEKDEDTQIALHNIGSTDQVCNETYKAIQKYVCAIYGKKKLSDINEVRMEIFLEKYRPKNREEQLSNAKKLEGSMMPPCWKVLLQKLRRCQLITRLWLSSVEPHPPDDLPEHFGWILMEGNYKIRWFHGETVPNILDIVYDGDAEVEIEQGMHKIVFVF